MTVEGLVRRYYEVVGDLASTRADLEPLLHEDLLVVEHPNPLWPVGRRRDKAAVLDGFEHGSRLLTDQSFDVAEVLVVGDRAAVRATWTGRTPGRVLVSHVAAFLTVRDGRVVHHESYDCYDGF